MPQGFARIARDINKLKINPDHNPSDVVCMRLADAQQSELKRLRGLASKGVNHVTKYLQDSGYPIRPAFGTELALNIVFHVFVLFLALTILYIIVVAPLEEKALFTQVSTQINSGVFNGFSSLESVCLGPYKNCVKKVMQDISPTLRKIRKLYAGEDPARKAHNQSVMNFAWAVVAALGLSFIVSVMILSFGSGVAMRKPVATIIFENLIIFTIIGAAEFTFFKLVAANFIPVKPSVVGKVAMSTLKEAFSTPK